MLITFEISAWTTVFSRPRRLPGRLPPRDVARADHARPPAPLGAAAVLDELPRPHLRLDRPARRATARQPAASPRSASPTRRSSLIYNFTGTMIGMVHALMPLAVLTMLSVMTSIDPTPASAPRATLGARGGERLLARSTSRSRCRASPRPALLVFITALGFFITPALLGGRRETMISQVIIIQVQELLNWGFAGALSVVLLVAAAPHLPPLRPAARPLDALGRRARRERRRDRRVRSAALGARDRRPDRRDARPVQRPRAAASGKARRPPRGDRAALGAGARRAAGRSGSLIIAFLVLPAFIVIPVSFTARQLRRVPARRASRCAGTRSISARRPGSRRRCGPSSSPP